MQCASRVVSHPLHGESCPPAWGSPPNPVYSVRFSTRNGFVPKRRTDAGLEWSLGKADTWVGLWGLTPPSGEVLSSHSSKSFSWRSLGLGSEILPITYRLGEGTGFP